MIDSITDMNTKTIGILAGMGPRSTAPFLELVIDECEKQYRAKYDDEFPQIMLYSVPAPFYIDKPVDQLKLEAVVCEGAKRLASTGVDFIAIPCNTVHAFFDHISTAIDIPLLNIIKETIKRIPAGTKSVVLVATQATIDSGLYQHELSVNGMSTIDVSALQPQINKLISSAKNGTKVEALLTEWTHLIVQCEALGAKSILVACTDLISFTAQTANLPIIDSSRSLAEATVRQYLEKES